MCAKMLMVTCLLWDHSVCLVVSDFFLGGVGGDVRLKDEDVTLTPSPSLRNRSEGTRWMLRSDNKQIPVNVISIVLFFYYFLFPFLLH